MKFTFKWPSLDRPLTVFWLIIGALGFLIFYIWRLGNLTPGRSAAEVQSQAVSSYFRNIINNPVELPHHLMQYALISLNETSSFWQRLPSAVTALIFIYLFYRLTRLWFGKLIAALGTILFATTPWIILLGRSATADMLLLAPLGILASYIWFINRKENKLLPWLVLSVFIGLSLYVPGLMYFLLIAGLIDNKRFRKNVSLLGSAKLIAGLIVILILIIPLVYGLSKNTSQIKQLMLFPHYWTGTINILKTLGWTISSIFWRTPEHINIIIDRIPMLNLIQIAFMIFGIYILWQRARKELYILSSAVVIAVLGATLNHNLILLTLAVPSLCVMAAAGMRYLYMEWREVFPNNPIANSVSLAFLMAVILLNVLIGARYALIAWPRTADTKHVYVIK